MLTPVLKYALSSARCQALVVFVILLGNLAGVLG